MTVPCYQAAADILDSWRDDILHGKPPTLYPVGEGALGRLEIGPGLVTLVGGAPAAGKTALVQQLVTDALTLTPGLKVLICNVEMPPGILLDRQLARLADLDLTLIRHRRLSTEHSERLDRGLHALDELSGRLAFVRPPFDLANVAASADAFGADLIVLDYIQRIGAPGDLGDRRNSVDATMHYLRQFGDAGTAIVVVSALSRSKDTKGRSSYGEGLSLASFRESSELEYGADDAFILTPADGEEEGLPIARVVLRHLKSRHGEAKDITLDFDRKHQRFTPAERIIPRVNAEGGKLKAALAAAWASTNPAPDDGEEW